MYIGYVYAIYFYIWVDIILNFLYEDDNFTEYFA